MNPNRLIIAHININSLRNKFEMLKATRADKTDILLISETKLNSSFPVNQFLIDGFSPPYRLDTHANGGGIMLYVREVFHLNLYQIIKIVKLKICLWKSIYVQKVANLWHI